MSTEAIERVLESLAPTRQAYEAARFNREALEALGFECARHKRGHRIRYSADDNWQSQPRFLDQVDEQRWILERMALEIYSVEREVMDDAERTVGYRAKVYMPVNAGLGAQRGLLHPSMAVAIATAALKWRRKYPA